MGDAEGERWGGISSRAVEARTGKGWKKWFRILDRAKAASLSHKEIARLLHDRHSLPGWWAQMVTIGYEQARGRRLQHQKPDGFEASASRTFPVPVEALYRHFRDARLRSRWLGKASLNIRKATEAKSMRVTWGDGTHLDIHFRVKGEAKSSVQIQHGKLVDEADVQARKAHWKSALTRLATTLNGQKM